MSLSGFNANRRIHFTNMTGMIAPVVHVRGGGGGGKKRVSSAPPPTPMRINSNVRLTKANTREPPEKASIDRLMTTKRPATAVQNNKSKPDAASVATTVQVASDHWTYGTATSDLVDVDTEICVSKRGSRVLLVFPMEKRDGDKVCMRLKSVDPDTATLSYHWIKVFDPSLDEPRLVDDFSLTP